MTIRDRIIDKIERNPNLLRDYINEDDAREVTLAAFKQMGYTQEHDTYRACQDTINRVYSGIVEAYVADHEAEEEAELRQELADNERDARREERDLEEYGGYDMCDYKHPTWKERML